MVFQPLPNISKSIQWTLCHGTGAGQIRHRYGEKIQSGVVKSKPWQIG
jgi:hypothetical protein